MSEKAKPRIDGGAGLPENWTWSTLGEVSEKPQYGWTTKATSEGGGLKLLRTTDITSGTIDWYTVPYCTEVPENVEKYLVRSGDILISRAGSVGVSFLLNNPERSVFASYLIRFRAKKDVAPKYFYYYLKSPKYWDAIGASKSGIAVPNVNASKLALVPIPIAPPSEQSSIVAEIEKQFSRLDEAVASLKRVKANLKRYKASVLKAAVEGKLTEAWRKQHPDVEPASKLLESILAERRAKWNGKGNYREPLKPDIDGLPSLPRGWIWATFEQVSARVTVGHVGPMKHEYVPKGIPFLRSQNVRENRFDLEGLLFIRPEFHKKLSKSVVEAGDLAVVRSGSVGVTCVIPETLGEANCADLVLIQHPLGLVPQFGAYYMNSLAKRRVEAGKVGVALTHFNTKSVAAMPVPIPSFAEQQQIVAEVERRLSVIDELEVTVEANLTRANRLRRSILGQAFSGELIQRGEKEIAVRG